MLKNKKLIIGLFIGILVFTLIGATFAYFTASATATGDAISGSTNGDIDLSVSIDKVEFTGTTAASTGLVPSDITATSTSVGNAVAAKCEASGYTGCHLYEITASSTQTVAHANINLDSLTVDSTDKASWKYVLYTGTTTSVTDLVDGGSGSFDLSESFDMHDGAGLIANTPVKYYLLIYIENSSVSQNSGDASDVTGEYSGTVSISAAGGRVETYFGPRSFATDSWETIVKNIRNNPNAYKVGDTKCIALDGFTTTNDNGCENGEFLVRIANTTTPAECSGDEFSQTACGFVVEFVDIITTYNMNPSTTENQYGSNVGSWPASAMYTYLNDSTTGETSIYNALPSDVRAKIINTKSVTGYGYVDDYESSIFISNTDKLYLLSPVEVWGWDDEEEEYNDIAANSSRQLDYYQSAGVTTSNYGGAVKQYQGSNPRWWLRGSVNQFFDSESFWSVSSDGCWASNYASDTHGVSPAFRIG